jgi:hypothetical protein
MKKVISIIAITGIIYFLYPKNEQVKAVNFKPNKDFGIISNEDIYIDNMEKGKYTKHGRLITKQSGNSENPISQNNLNQ